MLVDTFFTELNQAMHDSAKEAGCLPQKCNRPKPYWCPALSRLRDKKRMWWAIWTQCQKPRSGTVYDCYKLAKKQFRTRSRKCAQDILNNQTKRVNSLYRERKLQSFWNAIKVSKKKNVRSTLKATDLAAHYAGIMQDNDVLTEEQSAIQRSVHSLYMEHEDVNENITINASMIINVIRKLKRNCSPGVDGVTAEHLQFGLSEMMISHLCDLYSLVLSYACVPNDFSTGIIIPILKKSTLNPNRPDSYRPVTLSSIHSKVIEKHIMPECDLSDSQFGFRPGRGTTLAGCLLTDTMAYAKHQNTPLFICSLDAEKCFDNIWHAGLLYKMWNIMPTIHWMLLYRWYSSTKAVVRWNGAFSDTFDVTRGVRQGSVLSPVLFNCYVNDLLEQLMTQPGFAVGHNNITSLAYADDVTLISSTVPGLQNLMDTCLQYATKWRFRYGLEKTKCMVCNGNPFVKDPLWRMGDATIKSVDSLDVLGIKVTNQGDGAAQVKTRTQKCRGSYFALREAGLCYQGLGTDVNVHLWKTVCLPTLTYGCEVLHFKDADMTLLERQQSNSVKQFMGLGKRSRHSSLLAALGLNGVKTTVNDNVLALYHKLFSVNSQLRDINIFFLARYMCTSQVVKGSLLHRVVLTGNRPINIIHRCARTRKYHTDGVVDSLKDMVFSDNFKNPSGIEFHLTKLLCSAF